MSTPVLASPAGEAPPPKSFFERLVGVFLSPGEAFEDIARQPDFIAPLIALVLTNIAVAETRIAKIGMERIVRASLEHSSRASNMSPEQLEQAVSQGAKIGAIVAHIFAVIGAPILMLAVAGLGLLFVNVFFGAGVNFKTALAVACYGYVVAVLAGLMGLAMVLFGDPEHFNAQSPVPSNPGFFMNPYESSKPLLALASSLDIFTFWAMVLWGVGFSQASQRKVRALTIFFCYLAVWAVLVLVRMGLATLG